VKISLAHLLSNVEPQAVPGVTEIASELLESVLSNEAATEEPSDLEKRRMLVDICYGKMRSTTKGFGTYTCLELRAKHSPRPIGYLARYIRGREKEIAMIRLFSDHGALVRWGCRETTLWLDGNEPYSIDHAWKRRFVISKDSRPFLCVQHPFFSWRPVNLSFKEGKRLLFPFFWPQGGTLPTATSDALLQMDRISFQLIMNPLLWKNTLCYLQLPL
jgi:hypothetical protein